MRIGIGGASNSGKTSISKQLAIRLDIPLIHQDHYYKPSIPVINGVQDWESNEAFRFFEFRQKVESETHCIVEGIAVFDQIDEFDFKFWLRGEKEECRQRRKDRTYPGWKDPPNYFDDFVWKKHVEREQSLDSSVIIIEPQSLDSILSQILEYILNCTK